MFIVIVNYKRSLNEVERYLQDHRAFLMDHYAEGDIITSGPQVPRKGGIILVRADDKETVRTIISHDPFFIYGIADYEIIEFTPTLFQDRELQHALENAPERML